MEITKEDRERALGGVLDRYGRQPGSLIPILQEVQEELGYLPESVLVEVASRTGIPLSRVFGVVTFYSQFRLHPRGRHMIKVCHGTACHVGGAPKVTTALETELGVSEGETTKDHRFTLDSVACLGCCSLAPVMTIGDDTHGRMDSEKSRKVIERYE